MRATFVVVCLLICLGMVGTGGRPPVVSAVAERQRHQLKQCNIEARGLATSGEYVRAAEAFRQCYDQAMAGGNKGFAGYALANIGNVHFVSRQYRLAQESYRQARELALQTGDDYLAGVLGLNTASMYLQAWAFPEAEQAILEAERILPAAKRGQFIAQLLLHKAKLAAWQGDLGRGRGFFNAAILEADRHGDTATMINGWELLGTELLRGGLLHEAEAALLETLRLRKSARDQKEMYFTYRILALLRATQERGEEALRLAEEAIAAARRQTPPTLVYSLYFARGRALATLGRLPEAFREFRLALEATRALRVAHLPADSLRVAVGVGLQDFFSEFVRIGNELYFRTGDPRLAAETFQAAEENRAYTLRRLLGAGDGLSSAMPPRFGETLARLEAAEAALFVRDTVETRREVERQRLRLTELEMSASLKYPEAGVGAATSLDKIREALGATAALISFHLGEPHSWRWSVTSAGLQLDRLASRSTILSVARDFAQSVREVSPGADTAGRQLHAALFGGTAEFHQRPRWRLELDEGLFHVPFAALVAGTGSGQVRRLVEKHSLSLLPTASAMVTPRRGAWDGKMVALGDPVYNLADPRWPRGDSWASRFASLWSPSRRDSEAGHLPRLTGTAAELESSVLAHGAGGVVLTGAEAGWRQLREALTARPAVIHLATHMLPSPRDPRQSMLALALRSDGAIELVGADLIRTLPIRSRLVVMSGCSSGTGRQLPAEGLQGLTRAWQQAGARAVLATLWPTPDHRGELPAAFYRHWNRMRQQAEPGAIEVALQRAQVEAIESSSWGRRPDSWAAYFLVGN